MLKNLLIIPLFTFSLVATESLHLKPIDALSAQFSLYVEPMVHIEIDACVKEIASKVGYCDNISVIQPSQYAQETFPAYKYIVPNKQNNLILFINKAFFDSLTEKERFFLIGRTLMNYMSTPEKEAYGKWLSDFNKKKLIAAAVSSVTQLAITAGAYYYIGKKYSDRFNNWRKKIGASMAIAFGLALIAETPIKHVLNKKAQNKLVDSQREQLKNFLMKFDCLDSAISLYTKYLGHLNQETNTAYWASSKPIFEKEIVYLNELKKTL